MATVYKAASVGYWAPRLAMSFLPDVLIKRLKEAMDPKENLHVVDLDSRYVASTQVLLLTNFSATMSNVEEPKGSMLRDTWLRYKPGMYYKCFWFPKGDGSNWLSKVLILQKLNHLTSEV